MGKKNNKKKRNRKSAYAMQGFATAFGLVEPHSQSSQNMSNHLMIDERDHHTNDYIQLNGGREQFGGLSVQASQAELSRKMKQLRNIKQL